MKIDGYQNVVSDIEYNDLNVQYHWINKTDFGGCGFIADYHRSYGKHALIDYSFQRKDLIKHLFNIENKDEMNIIVSMNSIINDINNILGVKLDSIIVKKGETFNYNKDLYKIKNAKLYLPKISL